MTSAGSRVCVVIPTFNERANIGFLIKTVSESKIEGLTVLFVDDSSPDGTAEEVARVSATAPWVRLMVREKKSGIGSAYRDGFREALSTLDPAVLLEMDADMQHPPSLIPRLVEAVEGGADVAIASRYAPGGSVAGWGLTRRVVSRGANYYARVMLGLPVKDATSGFRAYSRRAATRILEPDLPVKGFEFQVAALKLLKTDMKIVEIPYQFSARRAGASKLGLKDTVRFFFNVMRIALG